jgi:hypothetical protein
LNDGTPKMGGILGLLLHIGYFSSTSSSALVSEMKLALAPHSKDAFTLVARSSTPMDGCGTDFRPMLQLGIHFMCQRYESRPWDIGPMFPMFFHL